MEIPIVRKAIINDTFDGLEIVISKKNSKTVVFLSFWLSAWAVGEIILLFLVISDSIEIVAMRLFAMVFVLAWTVIGISMIRNFLWNFRGKEIITIGQGRLTIAKKGAFFSEPMTYDLENVKNFRVQEHDNLLTRLWQSRKEDADIDKNGGPIRFQYYLTTIRFGIGIDEEEAKFILAKLKDKRLLTERNFIINA